MHYTTQRFWKYYDVLPEVAQRVADQNHKLLKTDPLHLSLHFRKVGQYWSVRAGKGYRALGIDVKDGISWVWIGTHAEYDKLINSM
jgi:hypothetical protein